MSLLSEDPDGMGTNQMLTARQTDFFKVIIRKNDPWARCYKAFFPCSILLSVEFILLINVKKIVGIITFISRIND